MGTTDERHPKAAPKGTTTVCCSGPQNTSIGHHRALLGSFQRVGWGSEGWRRRRIGTEYWRGAVGVGSGDGAAEELGNWFVGGYCHLRFTNRENMWLTANSDPFWKTALQWALPAANSGPGAAKLTWVPNWV